MKSIPQFNILPAKQKKEAVRYIRYAVLARITEMSLIWLICSSYLIFGAYYVLHREFSLVNESSQRIVLYNNYITQSGLGKLIKKTEQEINTLAEVRAKDYRWSLYCISIFSQIPEDIRTTSITGDASTQTMTIRGIAKTRDSLIDWKKILQNDSHLNSVELPLSQLLVKDEVPFVLTLSLKTL